MERKPRSSFLKLLSEPSFDFGPYFDKAVIEWLERNMSDFLEEKPEASVFFLKEREYRYMVAKHMPLDNDKQTIAFLQEINDGDYNSDSALTSIAPRLIAAGKADLLLHAATTLRGMRSNSVENIISAFSDEAIRQLYDLVNINSREGLGWPINTQCVFIKRLPTDLLIQVAPSASVYYDHDTVPNIISTLATRWPIEDIANFLAKYGETYPALFCMHCGNKTAKSKPGYTLHRKTCDPQNLHPNIWTSIAERTR